MEIFGKKKMILLMKSQFEYFTDSDAGTSMFEYIRFDKSSERLRYCDDYDNKHDLYHSMAGGKEILLYHVNNEQNRSLEIPGEKRRLHDAGGKVIVRESAAGQAV